jgi:hypothetical protein
MEKKPRINVEDIEKRQVFNVPDAYFQNLSANIKRKINGQQAKPTITFFRPRYVAAFASVCILLVALYTWFMLPQRQDPLQIIAAMPDAEIIDYLQFSELSQYDIAEADYQIDFPVDNQLLQQTEISSELLLDEADQETIHDYI